MVRGRVDRLLTILLSHRINILHIMIYNHLERGAYYAKSFKRFHAYK